MTSSDATEVGVAGIVVLFGTVLSMFAGFLFRLVLAQYTATETFGTIVLFLTLLNMTSIFCLLGLNRGVVKFTSEDSGYDSTKNTYIFVAILSTVAISVGSGVAALAFSDFVERTLFDRTVSNAFMYVFVVALPFFTVNRILGSALRGSMNSTGFVVFSKFLRPGLKLLLAALAVAVLSSTTAIVGAITFGFVLSTLFGLWLIGRNGWRPSFDRTADFSGFYYYSFPLMIASSVYILLTNFDKLMIGYYVAPAEVGRYEVALTIAGLLGIFNSAFSFLVFPKISRLLSSGRDSEIQPLYQQTTKWILLFTTPLFLILVLRPSFFVALFGEQYRSARIVSALSILALGFFLNAVLGPNSEALLGLGRSWTVLAYNVLAVVLNVALNVLLIPRFGLDGAAIASVVGYTLMNLLKSGDLFVNYGILSIDKTAAKMAAVSALAGAIVIRSLPATSSLLAEAVVVGVVAVLSLLSGSLTLYLVGGIEKADRELFEEVTSRLPT